MKSDGRSSHYGVKYLAQPTLYDLYEDDEPALCLTVIPIAYGPYHIGDAGSFGIEPPAKIQPAAGFPVFKE
jgi:hypothetical protein